MRTRCQDIIPRLLSTLCKDAFRGRAARQTCRPLLTACLYDQREKTACAEKCRRYYAADQLTACERDCNIARCKFVPPYENCVFEQTLRNVLHCIDNGDGRAIVQQCLTDRCNLQCRDQPLDAENNTPR